LNTSVTFAGNIYDTGLSYAETTLNSLNQELNETSILQMDTKEMR